MAVGAAGHPPLASYTARIPGVFGVVIRALLSGLFMSSFFGRVWSVRRESIPALPACDWSVVRVYPHFLRAIGPS
eukprot:1185265-Prorocentrum_minimum.AAC.1